MLKVLSKSPTYCRKQHNAQKHWMQFTIYTHVHLCTPVQNSVTIHSILRLWVYSIFILKILFSTPKHRLKISHQTEANLNRFVQRIQVHQCSASLLPQCLICLTQKVRNIIKTLSPTVIATSYWRYSIVSKHIL